MVLLALVVGFAVALVASMAVFLDASRRSLSGRNRAWWTVAVGAVSVGGFLVPYLLAGPFHRAYLRLVHGQAVVVTPYEILFLHLFVGVLVTALAILGYALGQRAGITVSE